MNDRRLSTPTVRQRGRGLFVFCVIRPAQQSQNNKRSTRF